MTNEMETAVFTISIDFELIWGTLDSDRYGRLDRLCAIEREYVIDSILDLFSQYGVSATWCTVGHLFLDTCNDLRCVERGLHSAGATEESAPLFHGRSLVEKILRCRVPQEIGCHTFSHIEFGDGGCSQADAEMELEACLREAEALGIEMHSFVFPRNLVGRLDILRAHGFTCFRGPEPRWWNSGKLPRAARRFGQLLDILSIRTPPVTRPALDISGLWNVPGSMLFTPAQGLRRAIPISFRVLRACKGLDEAVRQKKIFHLWFHPTDFAANVEPMLAGLREVLEYSRRLCDRNELRIVPMGSLVRQHDLVAVA